LTWKSARPRKSRLPSESQRARSYATGDLARALPEHLLEFQGRADHQVKVQGFRVELGAIEALLDAHPALQRSIVVSRGDQERAIVAYVVPNPGQEVRPVDVQRYVRERLPKYMIPAAVVVMDKMPLTATGKVDRGSLPAVTHAELAGAQYVAPRNDIEEALAAIWCKVLEIDRVGVHDTFFDIGGESLRAMQAISATNKVFQIGLSVRRLFDAPTVGDLAVLVREELAARAE
jgi:nonribosomal peptide synthetase protein BlmX